MLRYPIVQSAYFVKDVEAAVERAVRQFGAGPFFVLENIQLRWAEHRGQSCSFVHTSAYGQWGNMMMELVQQDVEGPSPFRDMYAHGQEGIHHMAMMVDDLEDAYGQVRGSGLTVATRAVTQGGTEFAFVDTVAAMGHMLELYEKSEGLMGFYERVRLASVDWDGREPIRRLSL